MLTQPTAKPPIARILWVDVAAASAATWGLALLLVEFACWGQAWSTHCALTLKTITNLLAGWFQSDADRYLSFVNLDWLRQAKFMAALALPPGAATWVGASLATPRSPEIHARGRLLHRGKAAEKAAAMMSTEKAKISGKELVIHDSLSLARHQVMQSIMVMGAQGGGKTQILWRIVNDLQRLGYKRVIFDLTKGDYTISTPGVDRIFALGDARSSVWAIWRDVRSLPDAESFARGLIPEGGADPMWANAARMVLVAILMKLINEYGDQWRWKELGETVWLPLSELKNIAQQHYPPALAAVADAESKTTQSILINLHAFMSPIYRFYLAWSDGGGPDFKTAKGTKSRAFSWIDWLNDDHHPERTIILQSNAKDKAAAIGLIRAMMEVQVNHMSSLEFAEKRPGNISYILDEMPQLGRLECLITILEILRSKNVMCVTAFQDIAQLRQIYPNGEDDKWLALLGTRFFAQVKGGASQDFVLKQIGKKEVHVPSTTVTQSASGTSTSTTYQRVESEVLAPHELELLGPQPDGIKAIALGHGVDVLELTWPYFTPQALRPVKVPRDNDKRQSDATLASAPDVAASGAAGDDPVPEITVSALEEQAPAEQSARPATDTDDLMLLTLPEPTKTLEIDTDSGQLSALEDAAKDEVVEAAAEAIDLSPELLSALLKIAETQDDAGGFCHADTPVVVTSKKKSRRRKAAQAEAEAAS